MPDPQEVSDAVNISVNVTDNYQLFGAWIEIYDPGENPIGNFSMMYDPINNGYHFNDSHSVPGIYAFTIWTNDTANNWNNSIGSFIIQDTIPPHANAGSDQTISQGDTVDFNASISADNVGIVNYTWTFVYNDTQIILYGMRSEFIFDVPDVYNITLNVTDEAGNWATDIVVITVFEKEPEKEPEEKDEVSDISLYILIVIMIALLLLLIVVVFVKKRREKLIDITEDKEETEEIENDIKDTEEIEQSPEDQSSSDSVGDSQDEI
jgi:hypothetical protein